MGSGTLRKPFLCKIPGFQGPPREGPKLGFLTIFNDENSMNSIKFHKFYRIYRKKTRKVWSLSFFMDKKGGERL